MHKREIISEKIIHYHEILIVISKVRNLEAYLDGKTNILDWNPFETGDKSPLYSTPLQFPSTIPSDSVLRMESDEVVEYVEMLEARAQQYADQIDALQQDTSIFAELVEKLNSEVLEKQNEPNTTPRTAKQKKR